MYRFWGYKSPGVTSLGVPPWRYQLELFLIVLLILVKWIKGAKCLGLWCGGKAGVEPVRETYWETFLTLWECSKNQGGTCQVIGATNAQRLQSQQSQCDSISLFFSWLQDQALSFPSLISTSLSDLQLFLATLLSISRVSPLIPFKLLLLLITFRRGWEKVTTWFENQKGSCEIITSWRRGRSCHF